MLADMVIENAKIWSAGMEEFAEFAAIKNGKFIYVGSYDSAYIGNTTKHVDAAGHTVIPGIIDSHLHMLGGGYTLNQIKLRDVSDKEEFCHRVREWHNKLPVGEWMLGGWWHVQHWDKPETPHRDWIDPITKDRAVCLYCMDGHSIFANSAALQLAGITDQGPADPDGGLIERDPITHKPTGILSETAMDLVNNVIPQPTIEQQIEALETGMRHALANGVTTVCDIPRTNELAAYQVIAHDKTKQHIRMFLYPASDHWATAVPVIRKFLPCEAWLEIAGLKIFMDGSIGSQTAFMREPYIIQQNEYTETRLKGSRNYSDNWRGILLTAASYGGLENNFTVAKAAHIQPMTHAIGDEANHLLLNAYETVYCKGKDEVDRTAIHAARCRAEHCQHLLREDIERFSELGIIASMQPYHKTDDGLYVERLIGQERVKTSYTYRTLLDAGTTVAFGSDWPIATINPMSGVCTAVTGLLSNGKVWQPQENITVNEALTCYTTNGAYSIFRENYLGKIAAGYIADFVILNKSPHDLDNLVDWPAIAPLAVYMEGKLVYAA